MNWTLAFVALLLVSFILSVAHSEKVTNTLNSEIGIHQPSAASTDFPTNVSSTSAQIERPKKKGEVYDHKLYLRLKRGFGYGGGYGLADSYGTSSLGGYGSSSHGHGGYGSSSSYGGAAAIAQQAANQAKAAANAQGTAAYQAAQQARSILAHQASQSAEQAKAVTAAKQIQVSQISQAAQAATAAAYAEATQAAKTRASVQAAQAAKHSAARLAHYGGYGTQEAVYAAKRALQEARAVAQWQAQMAYQAEQNAWALSQKLQNALHDLKLAQQATNKAAWAANTAQASIIGYGHG